MKSEVKEEIQTYIRYINENDLRDKCEEYIQMFFFLSQMMLEESLGADERVIQSMAQKMVGLLGQDLDIDFASPNDGMYGGLGVLTFSVHEIMGRTGELKETSELLDRFLLDQACQKADLFQQRKLSFMLLCGIFVLSIKMECDFPETEWKYRFYIQSGMSSAKVRKGIIKECLLSGGLPVICGTIISILYCSMLLYAKHLQIEWVHRYFKGIILIVGAIWLLFAVFIFIFAYRNIRKIEGDSGNGKK